MLPKEGDGIWYFPFGRQLFEIPLSNIRWTGNTFHADVTLLGQGGMSMHGTVSEDNSIQGTFDLGDLDISEIGGGLIQPKGFSGTRFTKVGASVSSG